LKSIATRTTFDGEIEFGRLLDRQVGRFGATQNLVHEVGSTPEQVSEVRRVGHQRARLHGLAKSVHGR
jgi:hypothetical protein